MKRVLMLLLAVVLVCSLTLFVGCNEKTETETSTETETETQTQTPPAEENTDLENAAEYVRQLYKDTTTTASEWTATSFFN